MRSMPSGCFVATPLGVHLAVLRATISLIAEQMRRVKLSGTGSLTYIALIPRFFVPEP